MLMWLNRDHKNKRECEDDGMRRTDNPGNVDNFSKMDDMAPTLPYSFLPVRAMLVVLTKFLRIWTIGGKVRPDISQHANANKGAGLSLLLFLSCSS